MSGEKEGGEYKPVTTWHEYMVTKTAKLAHQFHEDSVGDPVVDAIFKDVRVWVDGYTDPPALQIKHLIRRHGGEYYHYPSSSVTHIIATTLCDSKVTTLKPTTKVVRPEWITTSIERGKLLDWRQFSLNPVNQHIDVPTENTIATNHPTSLLPPHVESSSKSQPPEPIASTTSTTCDTTKSSSVFSSSNVPNKPLGGSLLNCNDPCFIKNYFQSSRLHHLSAWKNQFQESLRAYLIKLKGNRALPQVNPSSDKTLLHVDMDCFFVSVSVREHPELKGHAVAVCHSSTVGTHGGTAAVASCNYPARKFGVRNGMNLAQAKSLCPELQIAPYEFSHYEKASIAMYEVLMQYSLSLEILSCDEAAVDITSCTEQPLTIAEHIRQGIFYRTQCTASVGIGRNLLLAKLACKKAKPNGVFEAPSTTAEILIFLKAQPLSYVPGVGYFMEEKLNQHNIQTWGDLQAVPIQDLQSWFGTKQGSHLHDFSFGLDHRKICPFHERKSISAEVTWGIRFTTMEEVYQFVQRLSDEVTERLVSANQSTSTVTLKVARRRPGAPPPKKFLGSGIIDTITRSVKLSCPTSDPTVISSEAVKLAHMIQDIPPTDYRGIGIQFSSLKPLSEHHPRQSSLLDAFPKGSVTINPPATTDNFLETNRKREPTVTPSPCVNITGKPSFFPNLPKRLKKNTGTGEPQGVLVVPPLSQLDESTLADLPEDIRNEVLAQYKTSKMPLAPLQAIPDKLPEKIPAPQVVLEEPKPTLVKEQNHVRFQNTPFSQCRTPDNINRQFTKWVHEQESCGSQEIEVINCVIQELFTFDNLESVHTFMSQFRRRCCASSRNDSNSRQWAQAFNTFLEQVNGIMHDQYGSIISISPL
ncbi:DNA repair protein [Pelomyxa schiedti]|nr:DNA repair protein [Pelomyxa schiedti]